MSSEYANAVFSPDTARTPTPRSIENDPDFTMPSSRLQLSTREYWKYRSRMIDAMTMDSGEHAGQLAKLKGCRGEQ